MNFKTFYINRHQIGYQEVLLDDPVFEKAYLLENPKKLILLPFLTAVSICNSHGRAMSAVDMYVGAFSREKIPHQFLLPLFWPEVAAGYPF